ncbi:MAG: sigma-70 family RNA polymerase sigma factor [Thermoguttaceae bacterium]|nr:sigma-70 family RNA polymerase sigma factor [Thermoguttaceae bacterium]
MTPDSDSPSNSIDFNQPTPSSFLKELRNREQIAWERFIMLYGRLISFWCYRRGITNRTVRQEIICDVCIRVMESIDSFHKTKPTDKFRNWLHVIVENHINNLQRKHQAEQTTNAGYNPDALEVADPHSSVLEALIKQEQKERSEISASDLENLNEDAIYLQDLMRVLGTHFSKRDIDIYYQLTFERKKAVHVAEMMNLTPINVRQIRRRINTYLKEYFGELNDLDMPEEDE